jgi:transcriptional regulator with XRE-family HTH domain
MDFGTNLALLRKKKGLSQEELAFAVGISRQTLYTWEASLAYPNVADLARLAKALGVRSDLLLNGSAIDRFPKTLFSYTLTAIDNVVRPLIMEELSGWFIVPRPREEVSWAIYDQPSGKRDYSYHLYVEGPVEIHGEKGYEIAVEEYDPEGLLYEKEKRTFYAQLQAGKRRYLGMSLLEDGVKKMSDFKDAAFRKFWGEEESCETTSIGAYELALPKGKIKVFRPPLYSEKPYLIDQYVDEKGRTVLWKRYRAEKKGKAGDSILYQGVSYAYDYECWTSIAI